MGVQVDRQVKLCLQAADKAFGSVGTQQARHILNADGICAHLCQLLTELYKVLVLMVGADGIYNTTLNMCACFLSGTHCTFQVACIVKSIENTDDGYAVINRTVYKFAYNVIGIMVIAQNVLTAQQHLNRGFAQMLFERAQTLPGILVKEAQAGVKGGAAPSLQSIVAGVIQLFQCRQHVADAHSGGSKGLVAVTQDGFNYFYGFLLHGSTPFIIIVR